MYPSSMGELYPSSAVRQNKYMGKKHKGRKMREGMTHINAVRAKQVLIHSELLNICNY